MSHVTAGKKSENIWLMQGDCLERMKEIPDGSVDMVLADPPYGTTACKWDCVIPVDKMWSQLKRIIKVNGAIVMTSQQPFSTVLIAANMEMFKYSWIWEKTRPSGFAQCKNKPMSSHEEILVFSNGVTVHKGQSDRRMDYYPQGLQEINKIVKNKTTSNGAGGMQARPSHTGEYIQTHTNYPRTVLHFENEKNTQHPTQKPVELMEYLIKTYTKENETVLDFAAGSGTTGVACANTGRKFIGIELDEKYFDLASSRIQGKKEPS